MHIKNMAKIIILLDMFKNKQPTKLSVYVYKNFKHTELSKKKRR